jgi:tRNA pseudouridine55 synthase
VETAEREVQVYRFEERARVGERGDLDGERRDFTIECSSGTYVRSLIADLGDAYCEELRRTRIGDFSVTDADPDRIIGLDAALSFLPELRLDDEQAARAAHGVAVAGEASGVVRLTGPEGLIALAEPDPDAAGRIKPIVVLRPR